jgi:sterol desaturase/sphingolipid hydroxylase (fatty acid hydroxylase superfamily)
VLPVRSYGHYTTLFDGLFGTLVRPKLPEAVQAPAGAEESVESAKAAFRAARDKAIKAQ